MQRIPWKQTLAALAPGLVGQVDTKACSHCTPGRVPWQKLGVLWDPEEDQLTLTGFGGLERDCFLEDVVSNLMLKGQIQFYLMMKRCGGEILGKSILGSG